MKLYNRANAWLVTAHLISRHESFSLKHKYCRMPEYGFVDLNSEIVTPNFRTIYITMESRNSDGEEILGFELSRYFEYG